MVVIKDDAERFSSKESNHIKADYLQRIENINHLRNQEKIH